MIESQNRTVIVVEDELIVRDLAVCELEDVGFRVIDFKTADDALVYLVDHPNEAAVVFTDVQMPGRLSGLDLVEIVSRTWPQMQVLVTSGGTQVNPMALPPCARFVPKPWRAADIVSRVAQLAARPAKGPRFDKRSGSFALAQDDGCIK